MLLKEKKKVISVANKKRTSTLLKIFCEVQERVPPLGGRFIVIATKTGKRNEQFLSLTGCVMEGQRAWPNLMTQYVFHFQLNKIIEFVFKRVI